MSQYDSRFETSLPVSSVPVRMVASTILHSICCDTSINRNCFPCSMVWSALMTQDIGDGFAHTSKPEPEPEPEPEESDAFAAWALISF